ncbi:unnamed protein product [Sphagnum tenellum]
MQRGGVEPDPAVFVAVLNACAILAALEEGRHIEEQIIQRGYQFDVFVIASLLDIVHGDLEMGEYIAKKCFELNL